MNKTDIDFIKEKVDCTGDVVTGDYVFFEKAVFTGSYPNATFSHTEEMEGLVIKDSYGEKKQQHTFTIKEKSGNTFRIKGRNLYRNGCKRYLWNDEEERKEALDEKHERGSIARKASRKRKLLKEKHNSQES